MKLTRVEREAYKLSIFNLVEKIQTAANELVSYLDNINSNAKLMKAIEIRENTKDFSILEDEDAIYQTSIYSKLVLSSEQDPKRPVRLPGVLQIKKAYEKDVMTLVSTLNNLKGDFLAEQSLLKTKGVSDLIRRNLNHEALKNYSIKQITRMINTVSCHVKYCGLTYHTKPIVNAINKEEAIAKLNSCSQAFPPPGVDIRSWDQLLKSARVLITNVNDEKESIRIARPGSLRPMVNITLSNGDVSQPTASMPIILFTDKWVDVSYPRSNFNGNKRSDRIIDIDHPDIKFMSLHVIKKSVTRAAKRA